jgi:glycine/D-amino acid oxidase-like deaminating enzyme
MHVVIVGAGIAGACAGYFARQHGARVTLIDAGRERASDVPVALVNPVRGTAGKVVEGGFAATRFTFALVEALSAQGHAIGYGRGLTRPVPDEVTFLQWQSRMPQDENFSWRPVDAALNLSGKWAKALYLPEAGWIETRSMLDALIAESHADVIVGLVNQIDSSSSEVILDDGQRIGGDLLLWCGGGFGALLTCEQPQKFRPGSVLVLESALSERALSYGIYAAPFRDLGVVGSTSEPPGSRYNSAENPDAIRRLERRVASMWHRVPATLSAFRGVRFERLVASSRIQTLDGFGSRGFLLAPSAARNWAAQSLGR